MHIIAWSFAAVTAAWFGLMASKAGRNWVLWAVGGAIFALIVSTIVLGLGRATLIPIRADAQMHMILECIGASAVLIGVPGWFLVRSVRSQ